MTVIKLYPKKEGGESGGKLDMEISSSNNAECNKSYSTSRN